LISGSLFLWMAAVAPQLGVEVPDDEALAARIAVARSERGLAPLAWSPELHDAAAAHAGDMASRGYFGLRSPEGSEIEQWARTAGYDIGWITEKIGKTNGRIADLLDSWLQETRSTLFSDQAREIGIATASAGAETLLVIALATTADQLTRMRAADLSDIEAAREELLGLVNEERAALGRRGLHRHEALERAAQAHAEELLAAPEPSARSRRRARDPADRAADQGYRVRQIMAALLDGPTDVATAVDRWLGSDEHRRILLLEIYRDAGLGVSVGRDGGGRMTVMWVLYLARPRA
jgi:uncharacterized protein YkwD